MVWRKPSRWRSTAPGSTSCEDRPQLVEGEGRLAERDRRRRTGRVGRPRVGHVADEGVGDDRRDVPGPVAEADRPGEPDGEEPSAGPQPPAYLVQRLDGVDVVQDRDHRHQVERLVSPRARCRRRPSRWPARRSAGAPRRAWSRRRRCRSPGRRAAPARRGALPCRSPRRARPSTGRAGSRGPSRGTSRCGSTGAGRSAASAPPTASREPPHPASPRRHAADARTGAGSSDRLRTPPATTS